MTDRLHKYSTGRFGRIEEHADSCKEAVRKHIKDKGMPPNLASEFIHEIHGNTPKGENYNSVWQQFETVPDVLVKLDQWLS